MVKFKLPKTREMLRREAATWLARLQSRSDPQVERKFRRWRDRDPAHAQAFERVASSYQQAGLLRYSALASARAAPQPIRSPAPKYAWATAAALVLIVSAALYLARGTALWTSGTEAVMLSTKVGEIRRFSLADGSKVTLDTATAVEVEIGRAGRRALVRTGRARFEVTKGNRPFVIEAGNSISSAAGAVLDVEKFGDQARVDVVAGSARIGGSGPSGKQLSIQAGESVTAAHGRDVAQYSRASGPDWTRGMLEFDGTPLEAAVALANRYSNRKIVLSAGLDGLRVTGAFRAGDIGGLASALAEAFHLTLARTSEGNLVLSPSAKTSAPRPRLIEGPPRAAAKEPPRAGAE
ncbi:MAG TPA: FecR domain-containing protein [Sphingomicrobium sp.]|nr:FecR domain-containing protein [Sphingomicrobium sp.]